MNTNIITPKDLAETFHTSDKLVRKFLRDVTDEGSRPGRGSRWVLPGNKRELNRLTKQFQDWSQNHKTAIEHSR